MGFGVVLAVGGIEGWFGVERYWFSRFLGYVVAGLVF